MTISVTISVCRVTYTSRYVLLKVKLNQVYSFCGVMDVSVSEFPNAQNGKGNPSAHMLKGPQVPSST